MERLQHILTTLAMHYECFAVASLYTVASFRPTIKIWNDALLFKVKTGV